MAVGVGNGGKRAMILTRGAFDKSRNVHLTRAI